MTAVRTSCDWFREKKWMKKKTSESRSQENCRKSGVESIKSAWAARGAVRERMKGLGGEIGCGRGKQRESRRNGRWSLSSGAPSHLETSLVAALLEMDSAAAQSYLHPNASVSVSGGGWGQKEDGVWTFFILLHQSTKSYWFIGMTHIP